MARSILCILVLLTVCGCSDNKSSHRLKPISVEFYTFSKPKDPVKIEIWHSKQTNFWRWRAHERDGSIFVPVENNWFSKSDVSGVSQSLSGNKSLPLEIIEDPE